MVNIFASEKKSWFVLPAVVKLEGVGTPYGFAAGFKDLGKYNIDIVTGKTFGDVEGQGILFSVNPSGKKGTRYSVSYFGVDSAELKTTYQRELNKDDPLLQNLSGSLFFVSLDTPSSSSGIKFSLMMGQSIVKIQSYSTDEGEEINITGLNLHDVTTTVISPSVKADFRKHKKNNPSGIVADYRATFQMGRIGLSDTMVQDYGIGYYLPFLSSFSWVNRIERSDAFVTSQKTKYDTLPEIEDALGGDFSSISNTSQKKQSEKLKSQLGEQIFAENTLGTSKPLGGAYSLRGYREFRFKAKHTSRLVTELHFGSGKFKTVLFSELGFAADDSDRLYEKSVQSTGAAFHIKLGEVPLRLGAARGDEGDVWYLAVGQAF